MLGAVIRAGIEGIRAKLGTPHIFSGDPESLSEKEKDKFGIKRLPQSLSSALDTLKADTTVSGWFAPVAMETYHGMKRMEMKLEPDKLTELSPDKSWGLVRGKALEHYEANDGDVFDFTTRWTAVMVRGDDGKWRLRAIHFGTNNLDNPVLTKVKNTLIRDGIIGAVVALLIGIAIGWFAARRKRAAA